MTPLDLALAYIERLGWPVFPRPGGRWIGRGWKDATRDPQQIQEWWTRWPDAWIAMPTGPMSGVDVLDIDRKNGVNGFDTLAELGKAALPATPMTHSPHDGLHLFFADPPNLTIGCSQSVLGPGLDVKGHGGSVPLPTPGNGYRWDPHHKPSLMPLRIAPGWFAARKPQSPTASRHLDPNAVLAEACRRIRDARSGERHEILNREAFIIGCIVSRDRLERDYARHELEAAAAAMPQGNDRKTAYDLSRAFTHGLNRGPTR